MLLPGAEERADPVPGQLFPHEREARRLLNRLPYRRVLPLPQVEVAVLADPDRIGLPDVGDDLLCRELPSERLLLQEPHQEYGRIAGQEMAPDRVLLAHVHRPRVELRLPQPESPLDVPQLVVDPVHLLRVHPGLRRHQDVVASESPVPVTLLPVPRYHDVRAFDPLPGLPADGIHGDPFRVSASQRLLQACLPRPLLRLPVLPHRFPSLLPGEGRIVCRDALLRPVGLRPLPVLPLAFVEVGVGDLLVGEGHSPVRTRDVGPSVLLEPPSEVLVGHELGRLGEDVSVVSPAFPDVLGAVQALVGHLHDLRPVPLRLPYLPYRPREMGLLALVPREDLPLVGDDVGVQEQGHGDDRIRPVLLARPLPLDSLLPVDLEVVVGAVEVDMPEVSPEASVHGLVQDVYHVLAAAPEVAQPLVPLRHGHLPGGTGEHQREHVRERLPLRAWIDDPCLREGKQDIGKAELPAGPEGEPVDPVPYPETVRHPLHQEASVVRQLLPVPDLLGGLLLPCPLLPAGLLLEACLASRGRLPFLPELREGTEGLHVPVPVLLLRQGVVAVVDLEVVVPVLPLRLPQEIGHVPFLLCSASIVP